MSDGLLHKDLITILLVAFAIFVSINLSSILYSKYKSQRKTKDDIVIQRVLLQNLKLCANELVVPKHLSTTNTMKPAVFRIQFITATDNETEFGIYNNIGNKTEPITTSRPLDVKVFLMKNKKFLFSTECLIFTNDKINFMFNKNIELDKFSVDELYFV